MQTVWVALDPSTKENGCIKVMRRSHKMGRIDHFIVGGQQVSVADFSVVSDTTMRAGPGSGRAAG